MKTYVMTSAYNKAKLFRQCLEHIHAGPDPFPKDMVHVIHNNHYPVNPAENWAEILDTVNKYGCTYIKSDRDLGFHNSMNHALEIIKPNPEDVIIVYDADDRHAPNTLQAIRDVVVADKSLAVMATRFKDDEKLLLNCKKEVIGGYEVLIHPFCEMWNTAAYRWKFLQKVGGFSEPFEYYGGIESSLYEKWTPLGMRFGYLADPKYNSNYVPVDKNDPTLVDPLYIKWKQEHTAQRFKGSFETFVWEQMV